MEVGTLRIGIGFLFLLPVMYQHLKKESLKDWLNMSSVGLIGNGIPAFLYPIAQTKIPSFMAGTLNSLSSLFALVIAQGTRLGNYSGPCRCNYARYDALRCADDR
jgi:drug/metabolite transporter (DMT)-like permease